MSELLLQLPDDQKGIQRKYENRGSADAANTAKATFSRAKAEMPTTQLGLFLNGELGERPSVKGARIVAAVRRAQATLQLLT